MSDFIENMFEDGFDDPDDYISYLSRELYEYYDNQDEQYEHRELSFEELEEQKRIQEKDDRIFREIALELASEEYKEAALFETIKGTVKEIYIRHFGKFSLPAHFETSLTALGGLFTMMGVSRNYKDLIFFHIVLEKKITVEEFEYYVNNAIYPQDLISEDINSAKKCHSIASTLFNFKGFTFIKYTFIQETFRLINIPRLVAELYECQKTILFFGHKKNVYKLKFEVPLHSTKDFELIMMEILGSFDMDK